VANDPYKHVAVKHLLKAVLKDGSIGPSAKSFHAEALPLIELIQRLVYGISIDL
jgi:hypothetical protein